MPLPNFCERSAAANRRGKVALVPIRVPPREGEFPPFESQDLFRQFFDIIPALGAIHREELAPDIGARGVAD